MATIAIYASRSLSGNQPAHRRLYEKAAKTGPKGVPVTVTGGYALPWDGTTYTGAISGFSAEPFKNRTADGVMQLLSPLSETIENQPNSVVIGLPMFDDGRIEVAMAVGDSIFYGQCKSDQTMAKTDVGVSYGLTEDTDHHWYVDKTKTTTSGGSSTNQAVVIVEDIDANDTRGVFFRVLAAAMSQVA